MLHIYAKINQNSVRNQKKTTRDNIPYHEYRRKLEVTDGSACICDILRHNQIDKVIDAINTDLEAIQILNNSADSKTKAHLSGTQCTIINILQDYITYQHQRGAHVNLSSWINVTCENFEQCHIT